MNYPVKTPVAAHKLGVTYHQLTGLLRFGKIEPPRRDSSGDYLWTVADLGRARLALKVGRTRKAVAS